MLGRVMRRLRGPWTRIRALEETVRKRNESIQALKNKIANQQAKREIVDAENLRLKAKVAELYERNVSYARRIKAQAETDPRALLNPLQQMPL